METSTFLKPYKCFEFIDYLLPFVLSHVTAVYADGCRVNSMTNSMDMLEHKRNDNKSL